MSNTLPRRPVRFQEDNKELLKSMGYEDAKDSTDYVNDVAVSAVSAGVQPAYRTPPDRNVCNKMFRRYLNGTLDVDYAVNKVIDAIHRHKENVASLSPQDSLALQVIFPGHFDGGMDPQMAAAYGSVNLDLLPEEQAVIRIKVAAHLAEELNYNGGQGGGTVPGRHHTLA